MQVTLRARGAMLRCALCHDDLEEPPTVCAVCGTALHGECRESLATCPTLGCCRRVLRSHRVDLSWSAVRLFMRDWSLPHMPVAVGVVVLVLVGLMAYLAEGSAHVRPLITSGVF